MERYVYNYVLIMFIYVPRLNAASLLFFSSSQKWARLRADENVYSFTSIVTVETELYELLGVSPNASDGE